MNAFCHVFFVRIFNKIEKLILNFWSHSKSNIHFFDFLGHRSRSFWWSSTGAKTRYRSRLCNENSQKIRHGRKRTSCSCQSWKRYLRYDFILTQSPHKVQPLSRYWFSNFWIFFCLTSLSWCLNYINIRLTPLRPPFRGPGGPKVPKMEKLLTL